MLTHVRSTAFLTAFLIGSLHEMCILLANQLSEHLGPSLLSKITIVLTMSLIGLNIDNGIILTNQLVVLRV